MPPRRAPQPAPAQGTMTAAEVAAIVAQAVNAALAAVQQAPAPAPVVPPAQGQVFPTAWERARDAFQKAHPPEFQGGSDVVTASQWKKDIQRHLRMLECTEVQRQILATFKLVGAALQWWEATTTMEERDTMTIQDFWIRFDGKYFPSAIQTEMRRKLLDLKQGEKTVAEYEEEFTRLTNLVPAEVPTEERRILMFTDGLNYKIRQHLLGNLSLRTYADVLNAAMLHCQDNRFHIQGVKRGFGSSLQGKTTGGSSSGTQSGQSHQRQGEQGSQTGDYAKRLRSGDSRYEDRGNGQGQQGHQGQRQALQGQGKGGNGQQGRGQQGQSGGKFGGKCFVCGKYGHKRQDCPDKDKFPQQQNARQEPQVPVFPPAALPAPAPVLALPPIPAAPAQQGQYGRVYNIHQAANQQPPPANEGMFSI